METTTAKTREEILKEQLGEYSYMKMSNEHISGVRKAMKQAQEQAVDEALKRFQKPYTEEYLGSLRSEILSKLK